MSLQFVEIYAAVVIFLRVRLRHELVVRFEILVVELVASGSPLTEFVCSMVSFE